MAIEQVWTGGKWRAAAVATFVAENRATGAKLAGENIGVRVWKVEKKASGDERLICVSKRCSRAAHIPSADEVWEAPTGEELMVKAMEIRPPISVPRHPSRLYYPTTF